MSNEVDYYDVQNMIRDARSEIRGEISNAIAELRRDLHSSLEDLREGLGEERVDRQNAIESLQRTLDARTERFV